MTNETANETAGADRAEGRARIVAEVGSWPGVVVDADEPGELTFRMGGPRGRELGHLHGDRVAHLFFPKSQWHVLRAQGRIEGHPVFPGKAGPAARRIDDDEDVRDVIELFRLVHERVVRHTGDRIGRG